MRPTTEPQRLRVTFVKGEEVKYISHLDLMRLWERALRRAEVPLLHSQGYNPRPKISFPAPLAVGITGHREILDVMLERPLAPLDFATAVNRQLPVGVTLVEVEEVYATLPALQTQVQGAEYLATVAVSEDTHQLEERITSLLGSDQLPRQRRGREYDLRPLLEKVWLETQEVGHYVLGMRLRAGEQGTGRPDEVLDEMGLANQVKSIVRTRLYFSPAGEE
ncbi:MAG TPA: TIGR03936 family radical SAM-associated protein [Anaerolineae bacterium]|nr:TIGR03936 family radical SAM-associated protein [Anaerolineae bacterium]